MLLQAFLVNLCKPETSNSCKRVAATCLSIVCMHARTPYLAFRHLHEQLLGRLFAANARGDPDAAVVIEVDKQPPVWHMLRNAATLADKSCMWAVLLAFRHIVVHVAELDKWSSSSASAFASSSRIAAAHLRTSNTAHVSPSRHQHARSRSSHANLSTLHLCQVGRFLCPYIP